MFLYVMNENMIKMYCDITIRYEITKYQSIVINNFLSNYDNELYGRSVQRTRRRYKDPTLRVETKNQIIDSI